MKFIAFVIGAFLAHQTLACSDCQSGCQAPQQVKVSVKTPIIKAPCIDLPTVRPPVVRPPVVQRPVIQQIHFRTDVDRPRIQQPIVNQPTIPRPIISPPIIVTPQESRQSRWSEDRDGRRGRRTQFSRDDGRRRSRGSREVGERQGSTRVYRQRRQDRRGDSQTIYRRTTIGAGGCGCETEGPKKSQLRAVQGC